MLPKKNRLKKKEDFNLVYRKGVCYSSSCLLIYVLENGLTYRRCGFSISKKVSKRAVDRNRLRRQISSIYREITKSSLKFADIIFVARKDILGLSFSELKKLVESLFRRACFYSA